MPALFLFHIFYESVMELIYGFHAAKAVLERRPHAVSQLWLLSGRDDQRVNEVQVLAEQAGLKIQRCNRAQLDEQAQGGNHQGVILECRPADSLPDGALDDVLGGVSQPLILVLDQVTDPHNLGACLRSAAAAGAAAVVVPKDRAVGLNATVRKVACGATEIVPLIVATNLSRTLRDMKDRSIWLTGLAGEAEASLYEQDLKGGCGLVMGAEGQGLRRMTREHCDFLVRIPMLGAVESLNVSVAAGICLFEAVRQRS